MCTIRDNDESMELIRYITQYSAWGSMTLVFWSPQLLYEDALRFVNYIKLVVYVILMCIKA